MKPIRSVFNYGSFYGVRRFDWALHTSVWFDGKKMNGAHMNDAILFSRKSTAERHAKKFPEAQVVEVAQTLKGRCVINREKVSNQDRARIIRKEGGK